MILRLCLSKNEHVDRVTEYDAFQCSQSDGFLIFMPHNRQSLNIISTFHLFVNEATVL